jgi:hypothetical protein
MNVSSIEEPRLEFGTGFHVDPRAGIRQYGVYDIKFAARREKIFVGAVGTSDDLGKLAHWLERCSKEIPGKIDSRQPNLFQEFCGFNRSVGFRAEMFLSDETSRSLWNSEIRKVLRIQKWNDRIDAAVELYFQNVKFLAQNRLVDVIVCILPANLYDKIVKEAKEPVETNIIEEFEREDSLETNFRRALKAATMHLGKPIQLLRDLSLESNPKTQQDDATKAWNFCTALYYKANQTVPWRMTANANRPPTCFVGIGFYRSRDRKLLQTSLAQIFDELGNGVILRGTPIEPDKVDRIPHLTDSQAGDILSRALSEYKLAMGTVPARVVIHKTSNYGNGELAGFQRAIDECKVQSADYVTVMESGLRLMREGIYPPYRGMALGLDSNAVLLYTRGSVEYYSTYPGRYVPQPLEVRIVRSDESPLHICREIIGLTKLNWNNTQFDGKYPITIECARKVGAIMKYVKANEEPQIKYSYYM